MMTRISFAKTLALALLVLLAGALAACDGLAALGAPTDRFVIAPASGKAKAQLEDLGPTIAIVRKRLESLGLVVRRIEPAKNGQIIIEVSGANGGKAVAAAIGIKGDLSIRPVDLEALPDQVDQGIAPVGSEVLLMADGNRSVAVRRFGGMSGKYISAARPGIDDFTGQPMVMISFDDAGTRKFAQLTAENVGKPLAIVLDGKVLSAPVINEPITGGHAQITGGFTQEDANRIAAAISSGALPTAFTLVEHTRL